MKKRWCGILLVLLICLLSSACATEGGQTVKPSKQTEKQPVQSEYREEVGETQGIPDHLTSDDNSKDNYIGTYQGVLMENEAQNTSAIISAMGEGRYHIEITIIRLAALEDLTGYVVDDHIEFKGSDPSGNHLQGTIVLSENKLIIEITDTTWDYFYNGMTLEMERVLQ